MISRFFVGVLLMFGLFAFSSPAVAQQYVPGWDVYRICSTNVLCNTWRETKAQACADWASASTGFSNPVAGASICSITHTASGSVSTAPYLATGRCPTGYGIHQISPPSCIWNTPGQPWPGQPGTTPPPSSCVKGKQSNIRVTEPAPLPSAYAGCAVDVKEVIQCFSIPPSPTKYCEYVVENTGATAPFGTNEPVPQPSTPPVNPQREPTGALPGQSGGGCPKGTVQAGVGPDGVPMCIGTGTAPPNAPSAPTKNVTSQTTSNPDGSSTTTTTTTTNNTDGSTTTVIDKVTSKPSAGGTVTQTTEQTKTTSATPSGAAGAETKPPEQTNFCKQNPTLSICRESSVSGTCGQTACIGDAIQCATLRAAAMMQCKQAEDEAALKASPAKSLGDSILAGTDPAQAQIDAAIKGTTVDIGSQKLDQSGFLGAGGCIAPKTFNVMGKAIVMDFATACESAQPARYIILALGFLAGYLIISKSVLS